MIPYKEAFDVITSAYINETLNPMDACACFIGNLLGSSEWVPTRFYDRHGRSMPSIHPSISRSFAASFILEKGYTVEQIVMLENNFLRIARPEIDDAIDEYYHAFNFGLPPDFPKYDSEDSLYEAMVSTLEMLRQIHIKNGEDVDAIPLEKRKLATT